MASEAYLAKLRDPRWQKKRLEILNRDNWTCQMCGSKDYTLHVHHVAYDEGEPWETRDGLLVTACEVCHEMEPTWHKKMLRDLLAKLGDAGIRTSIDLAWFVIEVDNSQRTDSVADTVEAIRQALSYFHKDRDDFIASGDYYVRGRHE